MNGDAHKGSAVEVKAEDNKTVEDSKAVEKVKDYFDYGKQADETKSLPPITE